MDCSSEYQGRKTTHHIHTYQAEKYRLTFVGTPHRAEMLHWQRAPQPLVGKNGHLDRWEVGLSSYAAWPHKALQPIIFRPFPSTQQLSTAFTWPSSTSGTSSFTLQQWNLTRLKPYTTRPKNGGLNPNMGNLCAKLKLVTTFFRWCCVFAFYWCFVTSHYVDVNMKCSNASVTACFNQVWDLLSQLESWVQSECAQAKSNMEMLQGATSLKTGTLAKV